MYTKIILKLFSSLTRYWVKVFIYFLISFNVIFYKDNTKLDLSY